MVIKRLAIGLAAITLTACSMGGGTLATQVTAIPTFSPASSGSRTSAASQATDEAQGPAAPQAPALGGKRVGDLLVWIFSSRNPPVRGDNNLEALVTDSNGQPITDAHLAFDLDMINMSHGQNIVAAAPLGSGRYGAKVHFLMSGPWRVIVDVQRAGQTSSVRFDFMVNW